MYPMEKHFVAIKAQHYQIWSKHWKKDINHGSTIDKARAVKTLLSYGENGHLVATVGRNMTIPKSKFETHWDAEKKRYVTGLEDKIEEKRIDPDGMVGMCQDVKKTRRNRLKGQDRHSGFRTTTSPNFHKGK